MTFLPPRVASWRYALIPDVLCVLMCIVFRYQRGNRCLVTNVTAPVQNVNTNKVTMEPEVINYEYHQ